MFRVHRHPSGHCEVRLDVGSIQTLVIPGARQQYCSSSGSLCSPVIRLGRKYFQQTRTAERYPMAEQPTGIPLADGLRWTLDGTQEHPERYMTIIGDSVRLSLNKVQALALFRIMLSHLAQIAGDELHHDRLLKYVDLVQLFDFSMELLEDASDADLEDRQTLKEALEQYYFAYDFRKELLTWLEKGEEILRLQYDRLESAADKINEDLEALWEEEEDEDGEEDETSE